MPEREEDEGRVEPIEAAIDLHTFLPREASDLVTEYLHAAWDAGLREVRVIHGKGTGKLRRTVIATLRRHPRVADYYSAPAHLGGWGATMVVLGDPPEQWPEEPPSPETSKQPRRSMLALMVWVGAAVVALWTVVILLFLLQ